MFKFTCIALTLAFIGNQLLRFHIDGVGITILDISIGIISISWFVYNFRDLRTIFWKNDVGRAWIFFVTAALFSLTVNISLLTTSEFFTALLYLLRWVCYSIVFFAVRSISKERKETINKYLLFVGTSIIVIGFIQYFFYSNLQNLYYLGWDDHMYRLFSVFLDPNFAAAFIVLFIILLFTKTLRTKITSTTSYYFFKRIILLLAIGATLLTFSRSGLIMFVVSLGILFTLENKKKFLLVILFGITVFIIIASQFFYLENVNLLRSASSNERIKSATHAIQIIQTQPILGVGFNAYKYAQVRMGYRVEEPEVMSHADSGTDNSLLFILATTGIVGTMFYLNFLYRIFQSFTYRVNGKIPQMTMISVVSFIGIVVDSIFINSLFYPSIMLWLYIIWGLSDYK